MASWYALGSENNHRMVNRTWSTRGINGTGSATKPMGGVSKRIISKFCLAYVSKSLSFSDCNDSLGCSDFLPAGIKCKNGRSVGNTKPVMDLSALLSHSLSPFCSERLPKYVSRSGVRRSQLTGSVFFFSREQDQARCLARKDFPSPDCSEVISI